MKSIAIRENHLYKKTYVGGEKASGRFTVIYVLKDKKAYLLRKQNPQKCYVNRIGLSVTKKVGGAVVRNRVKRIIRAALSLYEKSVGLKKGYLVVISAREAAKDATSTQIYDEMLKQFARLNMAALPQKSEQTSTPLTKEKAETIAPATEKTEISDQNG